MAGPHEQSLTRRAVADPARGESLTGLLRERADRRELPARRAGSCPPADPLPHGCRRHMRAGVSLRQQRRARCRQMLDQADIWRRPAAPFRHLRAHGDNPSGRGAHVLRHADNRRTSKLCRHPRARAASEFASCALSCVTKAHPTEQLAANRLEPQLSAAPRHRVGAASPACPPPGHAPVRRRILREAAAGSSACQPPGPPRGRQPWPRAVHAPRPRRSMHRRTIKASDPRLPQLEGRDSEFRAALIGRFRLTPAGASDVMDGTTAVVVPR